MSKNTHLKLVFLLTVLGAIGILSIIPYEITLMSSQEFYQTDEALPIAVIITINTIMQVILLFILVFIGVKLQRGTQLRTPIFESWIDNKQIPNIPRKWFGIGIGVSFILSLIMILLDKYVLLPLINSPLDMSASMPWWQGILSMFYGGITEELMIRLFGMTFIIWILAVITRKKNEQIPPSYYVVGILLSALLFGLGHIPATIEVFGELSTVIVIRALLINGILGIWFGYLYWKKGLEYAIVAHMSADLFIHVFLNSLFY